MVLVAKNMDFAATEWHSYRRRFPSRLPLAKIDLIRPKHHWMRAPFGTCNFSLIVRGEGEYWCRGHKCEVRAPCVIIQWPNEPLEYGPTGSDGTWDELYMVYPGTLLHEFQNRNLLDPDEPVWPIRNLPAVEALIGVLFSLTANPVPAQVVDRIDRVCEQLILETHLPPPKLRGHSSEDARVIQRIESELVRQLDREIDLAALVARHGMSMRTFRRRWAEAVTVPPARHRQQARLREACRLLQQTHRPIFEIARLVGFPDELYFSRRFHREFNLSPRAYRQMY